jgi:hypothetical protein
VYFVQFTPDIAVMKVVGVFVRFRAPLHYHFSTHEKMNCLFFLRLQKTLTITIKDTLQPNTTAKLRSSIADNNEENPLKSV